MIFHTLLVMFSSLICAKLIFFGFFHTTNAIFCSKIAAQGQFKYLVEIVYNGCGNLGICGGAVIDETHIITAAHCVYGFDRKKLFIIAGTNDLWSNDRIERKILKIIVHDEYIKRQHNGIFKYSKMKILDWLMMRSPYEHDIAVLKLVRSLPLGEHILSVKLPKSPFLPYYERIPFASWGNVARNTSTNMLKWANFHILHEYDCYKRTKKYRCHQFCVIHPNECSTFLPGDSGAPLVHDNTVIGVTSHGSLSSSDPAIFIKVYDYLEFIEESLTN